MPSNVPQDKPRLSYTELKVHLDAVGFDAVANPVFVAGLRGYYRNLMGEPGKNDRGIYDDAIFLVSPAFFGSYNANTDPSRFRPGSGTGEAKGIASLKPGIWRVYRFDLHQGSAAPYEALCQRAGPVTVLRDGPNGSYEDTGMFGINIHRGGWGTTSSLGCQTIYPSQWDSFIASAKDQAKRFHGDKYKTTTIPYILLDLDSY